MKNMGRLLGSGLAMVAILATTGANALAIDLFRDEMTNSAAWGANVSSADTNVTFNYDYSADGIPEAPNIRVGDSATRGVKLEANIGGLTAAETLTIFPTGQNFTGNYTLRFDAWMNFDAVEFHTGTQNGTTEFLGGGIGYDNVASDVVSGAQSIATGDGGSASDWRSFKSPPQFFIPAVDMAAGSRNASSPYYTVFLPAVAPPASQGQSPQLGVDGAPGFQWITWETTFDGTEVVVTIEKPDSSRLEIVRYDPTNTLDGSSGVTTDGNISIFYGDFFTSVSPRPDLTFGLVDNVEVTTVPGPGDFDEDGDVDGDDFLLWQRGGSPAGLTPGDLALWQSNYGPGPLAASATAVPEPTSCALLVLGGIGLASLRRKRS